MRGRLYRFAAIGAISILVPGLALADTVWKLTVSGTAGSASRLRVQVRDAQGHLCETSEPCEITSVNSISELRSCIAASWNRPPPQCTGLTDCDACPAGCAPEGVNALLVSQTNSFTLSACSCAGVDCAGCDDPGTGFTELTSVGLPVAGTSFLVSAIKLPQGVPGTSPAALVVLLVLILATTLWLWARQRRRSPPAPT